MRTRFKFGVSYFVVALFAVVTMLSILLVCAYFLGFDFHIQSPMLLGALGIAYLGSLAWTCRLVHRKLSGVAAKY